MASYTENGLTNRVCPYLLEYGLPPQPSFRLLLVKNAQDPDGSVGNAVVDTIIPDSEPAQSRAETGHLFNSRLYGLERTIRQVFLNRFQDCETGLFCEGL